MNKFKYLNEKAAGLKDFTSDPTFESSKKASLDELKAKSELSSLITRKAGQGFKKKAKNAQSIEEGTQVDFIVIDDSCFYVGDIKKNNSILNIIEDVPMINVSSGVVVSMNAGKQVVEAQIDRLTIGDKDTYNKVNFNQSVKKIAKDGKKYQMNNQKSLSLFTSLPESNVGDEIDEILNDVYSKFQLFHDYALEQTEKSVIGQGSKFKNQSMFLSTKDVLRGLIQSLVPDASEDEIKNIVGSCFASNGVGPLSTMSIDFTFTVSKVVRTKDPSKYPEYNEIDEVSNALRTFVTAYNVSVPINPQILVSLSAKMENFKRYLISSIIKVHNLAMDESADMEIIPCPDLSIDTHVLAGITKKEFSDFQSSKLPKVADSGVKAFFDQKNIRIKERYVNIKEEEKDDDFDN